MSRHGAQPFSVSIVAPAYNAAAFYGAWVRAIQAQNLGNFEVVLVDDGSSDDLCRQVEDGPDFVKYIRQENRGPASARNTGIRASTGDAIAFLDLDDLWATGHLQRLSQALCDQPDAGIAQGLIRNFRYGADGQPYFCSKPYRFINVGSSLVRRWVFEKAGFFDERMKFAEDFDFLIRCWEQGIRKVDVDELSLLYHRHETNMTNGRTVLDLGGVLIYKRRLDRIRAGQVDPVMPWRLGVGYPEYIGRSVFPFDEGIREPVG